MKKYISVFFLLIIGCASLLLFSCSSECEHKHLTSTIIYPTCETEGYTLNTCVDCSSEFKTNYRLPHGHNINETIFAPTCKDEGYTYYSCDCGYSYRSAAIPPLGHTYTEATITSTCESAGYTEHTCSVCAHSYKSDIVAASGHNTIKKETTFPTKTTVGYTEYSCDVCSRSFKDDFVFYSDVYGGGTLSTATLVSKGIDVSKWQNISSGDSYKALNWTAIKESGVDFAILRAGNTGTESGNINKDPTFDMNYEGAKAAGVMVGAYYYSAATNEEKLDEEIDALLTWLDGKEFEYPIYIDMEDPKLQTLGRDALTRLCMRFVDRLRENGYFGAVYTNQNWLDEYLYRDLLEGYCDIWFAHYVSNDHQTADGIYAWDKEKFGSILAMWQYTDSGVIENSNINPAVTVDLNYCYKDYPTIIKTYGLNGYTADVE